MINSEEFIIRLKSLNFEQLVKMYGGMCSRKLSQEQEVLPYVEKEILRRYYPLREEFNE